MTYTFQCFAFRIGLFAPADQDVHDALNAGQRILDLVS